MRPHLGVDGDELDTEVVVENEALLGHIVKCILVKNQQKAVSSRHDRGRSGRREDERPFAKSVPRMQHGLAHTQGAVLVMSLDQDRVVVAVACTRAIGKR